MPEEGVSSPAKRPSKVDFPLPERPTIARRCLAGTENVTSDNIKMSRPPLG